MLALLCALTLSASPQWTDPVERLAPPEDLKPLLERLGPRTRGVWLEGNELTFLYRSDAAEVGLTTMIGVPFEQVQPGLYLGQVRVPDSERLVMSYAFTEGDQNGWDRLQSLGGTAAPAIPEACAPIAGQHLHYVLESEFLEEPRRLEVYVPATDAQDLPVVYMADGSALGDYVATIDWAIRQGRLAPVVLVGVHNGGYDGTRGEEYDPSLDKRAMEYLSGLGYERYEQHLLFLLQEVLPFVEARHPVSVAPEDRMISGYSNGGAFAVTAGTAESGQFGTVLAYSVAFFDRDELRELAGFGDLPRYRLAAGTLESFVRGTEDAHGILEEAGAKTQLRTYVAGHDPLLWRLALLEDLLELYPAKR